eukprot:TRINITY_DN10122_c0_g2_i1.p1 TRINITY_DN10122_c0_g2~~TRINITY_DN10122_c0_g2_i1.p1  ORF type:complete len:193 (-),score=-18.12 TRINITY_DN10122_c0_g2_i1:1812-2390(-)
MKCIRIEMTCKPISKQNILKINKLGYYQLQNECIQNPVLNKIYVATFIIWFLLKLILPKQEYYLFKNFISLIFTGQISIFFQYYYTQLIYIITILHLTLQTKINISTLIKAILSKIPQKIESGNKEEKITIIMQNFFSLDSLQFCCIRFGHFGSRLKLAQSSLLSQVSTNITLKQHRLHIMVSLSNIILDLN